MISIPALHLCIRIRINTNDVHTGWKNVQNEFRNSNSCISARRNVNLIRFLFLEFLRRWDSRLLKPCFSRTNKTCVSITPRLPVWYARTTTKPWRRSRFENFLLIMRKSEPSRRDCSIRILFADSLQKQNLILEFCWPVGKYDQTIYPSTIHDILNQE